MDQMTSKEKAVVEELRIRTINDATPKMLEDVSLFYRFAKAREFNLADAEAMLRNSIAFRNEMKMDTIITDYEPPEVLVKYIPTGFIGFDKTGCIIRLLDCGRADAHGLWSIATKTDWVKSSARIIEQDMQRVIKRGGNLGTPMYAGITDFEHLTYANTISLKNVQYLRYLLKLYFEHYPEVLKTTTVINAPSYFVWMLTALKPVLPSTVFQKIRIYGRDGWKEVLLNEIDADVLPSYLGGNRTDPDGNPLCESFIVRGQPIPKHCYLQNRTKKLTLEPDVEKRTIMPFSKEEITLEVKEDNSYLEWEFQTKSKNIDFSLLFRSEASEGFVTEELIPRQRIDTSDEPHKGYLECEKLGKYTFVFDNSYSWFNMKEVYYRARIKNTKNCDISTL